MGVYPLSILLPVLLKPITTAWPVWLTGLVMASLIVISLTWIVMPNLTRLFEKWLFKSTE